MNKFIRNAYAIPAKNRQNAGAHTHKKPPRQKHFDKTHEYHCHLCGNWFETDDSSNICSSCNHGGN